MRILLPIRNGQIHDRCGSVFERRVNETRFRLAKGNNQANHSRGAEGDTYSQLDLSQLLGHFFH